MAAIKPVTARDSRWYQRLARLGAFEPHQYFTSSAANQNHQKADFFSGKIKNPRPDYPQLKLGAFVQRERKLQDLAAAIAGQEKDPVIRQTYAARLAEKIAEAKLLQAAAKGEVHQFMAQCRVVYGEPSREVLDVVLDFFWQLARSSRTPAAYARPVISHLEKFGRAKPGAALTRLAPAGQWLIGAVVQKKRDRLLKGCQFDYQHQYSPAAVRKIFQQVLRTIRATGWQARTSATLSRFSVNHQDRTILIPARRATAGRYLEELIIHEIGVHVLRRVNGERTPLKLLGLGLDHYAVGEEGWAELSHQVLLRTVGDIKSQGYFLGAALAGGLDGTPRDFRQTYEALRPFVRLWLTRAEASREKIEQRAPDIAYHICQSIFRGTDCRTPGVFFTKDIIYATGLCRLWSVITERPQEISRLDCGKYDPANANHRAVLDQLSITGE